METNPPSLPVDIEAPTVGEFHVLASHAADLGRGAIPALMLLARDGHQPLGRLCAICALGRMSSNVPVARVALIRIARLPRVGLHGYVVRAAVPDYRWPFEGSWDPLRRMESLDADWWDASEISAVAPRSMRSARPTPGSKVPPKAVARDRFGTPIHESARPEPSMFPDGWWREQD